MSGILQIMLGIGVGLVGLFLVMTPLAIGYTNQPDRNNRPRKKSNEFLSKPDDKCPICLLEMQPASMSYLACGHALHDDCLKKHRKFFDFCPTCRKKM